jgi:hypothetical protein
MRYTGDALREMIARELTGEVPDDSAVAATARCVRVTGLTSEERIAIP